MKKKKTIILLKNILQYIYKKTKKTSKNQYHNLQNTLFQIIFKNKNNIYYYFIKNYIFLHIFKTNKKKIKKFSYFPKKLKKFKNKKLHTNIQKNK